MGNDLVGADVLGDAAGLPRHDVGLADRVQQLGLAMVDVTHDGDDRRTGSQVGLLTLVLAEVEVERLQEFAILVFGRDDLHIEIELAAQESQRVVIDRLRGRDHLAEFEQHRHEISRTGVDLLGEVGEARSSRQPHHRTVASRQTNATDGRCLHVVEFLALGALGLASTRGPTTGLAERTRRAAATTGSTASGRAESTASGRAARTAGAGSAESTATATRTAAGATTGSAAGTSTGSAAGTSTRSTARSATGAWSR